MKTGGGGAWGRHLASSPWVVLDLHVSHGLLRNVDVRLPGKDDSNYHVARPVHLVITVVKCIRTSQLKNCFSLARPGVWFGLKGLHRG